MYDELVKRLRICPDYNDGCVNCPHEHDLGCRTTTMHEAADAIEVLQEDNAALNGTVSNLIQQIAELSKPKWIPVTERLPSEFEPVYAAVRSEGGEDWVIEVEAYDPYLKCPWGHIPILKLGKAEVFAWMPKVIPEPPKEE